MTDAELNEIEARERAATPGPWELIIDSNDFLMRTSDRVAIIFEAEDVKDGYYTYFEVTKYPSTADEAFLNNARTDVPKLIAEVRRLREVIRDAAMRLHDMPGGIDYGAHIHNDWVDDPAPHVAGLIWHDLNTAIEPQEAPPNG